MRMTKVSSAKKELGLVERRDYVRYLKESNWGKQRWRIEPRTVVHRNMLGDWLLVQAPR